MSSFVDRLLVQFGDPAQVAQVLAPPGDAAKARLRALLDAVYDQPFAVVHDVRDLQVRRTEFQRPVAPPRRRRGTWTQTSPSYARTEVSTDELAPGATAWIDVVAEVDVSLLLELDPGEVESIFVGAIEGFQTLDEFKARFQFLDLDAFLERLGITTVEELKARYQTLLAEVRLKPPAPFDPNDPANLRRYPLRVAILIREALDVAALLREAKLLRAALEGSVAFRAEFDAAEVRSPYALLIVLPEASLAGQPWTADALGAFFAAERVVVAFLTPA